MTGLCKPIHPSSCSLAKTWEDVAAGVVVVVVVVVGGGDGGGGGGDGVGDGVGVGDACTENCFAVHQINEVARNVCPPR